MCIRDRVGWSQEFLDQLVGSRVKGEKEGTAPPRYEFKDMPIQMFHDLCQIMALFFDRHLTTVKWRRRARAAQETGRGVAARVAAVAVAVAVAPRLNPRQTAV